MRYGGPSEQPEQPLGMTLSRPLRPLMDLRDRVKGPELLRLCGGSGSVPC